jgi:hypothetical protein
MNPSRLLPLAAAAFLGGCASVSLPPETAAVPLVPVSSKSVAIYQPKLLRTATGFVLDGWVYPQFGVTTTAKSHLDVIFFDSAGRELKNQSVSFLPGDLRRTASHRMQPRGYYQLPFSALPAGTARVEIHAHDEPHAHQS